MGVGSGAIEMEGEHKESRDLALLVRELVASCAVVCVVPGGGDI